VGKGGGGIGVYVREGLSVTVLASSPVQYCGQPEYLIVKISASGLRPFLLAIVYRPPKLGHLVHFQSDFERLSPSFPSAVIIGDFNINLNCQSFDATSLRDFCQSNRLYIVPFTDTHHTATSHTRIDHCLVSNRAFVMSHCQHALPFLSCHDLIEVSLDCHYNRLPPRIISVRDLSNLNPEAICAHLASFDWASFHHSVELDDKVAILSGYLHATLEHLAPLRSFRARRPPAPWINRDIRFAMSERDSARRAFRRRPSLAFLATFRSLRNRVNILLDKARNDFLAQRINSASSPARLWSELRSMGLAKSCSSTLSPDLDLDQLNSFFTSCSPPLPCPPSSSSLSPPPDSFHLSLPLLTHLRFCPFFFLFHPYYSRHSLDHASKMFFQRHRSR
jgi:hypothetical protein